MQYDFSDNEPIFQYLDMEDIVSGFKQYNTVTDQIKQKLAERKKLLTEKKALSPLQFSENRRMNAKIAETTEELEELKSQKEQVTSTFGKNDDKGMKDVKAWIDRREEQIQQAEAAEAKYSAELDKALNEFHHLEARAEEVDPDELEAARLSLRTEEEKRAISKVEEAYGSSYDYATMREARNQISGLLGEEHSKIKSYSVRENLKQKQQEVQQGELPKKKRSQEWAR